MNGQSNRNLTSSKIIRDLPGNFDFQVKPENVSSLM